MLISNDIWIYDLFLVLVEAREWGWVSVVKIAHVARMCL